MDLNKAAELEVIAPLSRSEQRALETAEHTIAKGLKAFVSVGLALQEIRDRRLYRAEYDTFEEYVFVRWEMSRSRAYQLVDAGQVVTHLMSTIVDIKPPDHEGQVRPLMRLKDPELQKTAWQTAVKSAAHEGRRVTARDAMEAVKQLNGQARAELAAVNGGPIYTCVQGDNSDLLAAVARLYLPPGLRIADITYGRGTFWNKIDLGDYEFHKSDKITCPASPHDFRKLPHKTGYFNAVVFDPPYAPRRQYAD